MATPNSPDYVQAAFDTVKFARLVKQTYGRNSITRKANETMAQFPMVFSADIPMDDAMVIAKGLEAQYAALLVAFISAHSEYDRAKYDSPAAYLKHLNNAENVPAFFLSMDSQLPNEATAIECAVANAFLTDMGKLIPKEVVMECWDYESAGAFNTNSLNGTYTPHSYTQRVMESVVAGLRQIHTPALEGSADTLLGAFGGAGSRVNKDNVGAMAKSAPRKFEKHDPNTGKLISKSEDPGIVVATTGKQEIIKSNSQMASLEPTLVNLQLTSHHGGAPTIVHNVVMPVKAKARVIPQDLIIEGLSDGVNNSRAIFNYIKWSEGDYRLVRDGIFDVSNAKTDAIGNRDMRNWLNAIKARRRGDSFGKRTSGEGLPPITTIVCSSYEVARVAELTGMDLTEAYTAAKLIAKYWLLGFVIYEPETGTMQCMFDGDTYFTTTSVNALKQRQKNSNDTDLTQFAAFLRAAGRT